jgi:phosphoadenosine phosphosulfate reductase
MGPPSRQIRWCCTIFKAGPINNLLQTLGDQKVLTFYGVRHAESRQRADYNAVTVGAKIGTQITASPIIDWGEFDVWLYLLLNGLRFNDSYRLGYTRVGCWLCPLNSDWSDMLAAIFFPEDSLRWRGQLVQFARKIGKPDPDEYVDDKAWKRRTGGAGLENRFRGLDVRPCGDRDDTLQYALERPITEELHEFLKPLGRLNLSAGRAALGEFTVEARDDTGARTKPAAGASPLNLLIQALPGSATARVGALDAGGAQEFDLVQSYVRRQLVKFQTCIQCTACSAVCPHGAITVRPEERVYRIDEAKCTGCLECVTHFGTRGCLVADSLHSSGERPHLAAATSEG